MRSVEVLTAILVTLVVATAQANAAPPIVEASVVLKRISADRGHVVLVNFWATWCLPCCAEYPSLTKLDRKYRKAGLDVVAVSLDFGSDAPAKVQKFVLAQDATFPQFILDASDPDAAINAFDTSWQGDLPRTFVYGRSGKLIKTLKGPQKLETFEKAVIAGLAAR